MRRRFVRLALAWENGGFMHTGCSNRRGVHFIKSSRLVAVQASGLAMASMVTL